MTFAGRMRLFLLIAALIPPLIMVAVVYYYAQHQQQIQFQVDAQDEHERIETYREQFTEDLIVSVKRARESRWFAEAVASVNRGRRITSEIDARWYGLDFLELLDEHDRVLASWHRPGSIGSTLELSRSVVRRDSVLLDQSVEFDIEGPHPAFVVITEDHPVKIYGGRYLTTSFLPTLELFVNGDVDLYLNEYNPVPDNLGSLEPGSLYNLGNRFGVCVAGCNDANFKVIAELTPSSTTATFEPYFNIILVVMLVSIALAVVMGFYITQRAKREITNLVDAFTRVASGELNVAVMAYEEGEFSQLADSFSEMMRKLRESQNKLAMAEKIAAWEAIGRKIAHEVKNPLTPIAVCADDLRRSYQEKLPDFDGTLDRNTRMIKEEVDRLRNLLNEFVSFARMKPPELQPSDMSQLLEHLKTLHAKDCESGRLQFTGDTTSKINADSEQLTQVLVNLIKNGLEASEKTRVTLRVAEDEDDVILSVTDNGPGFPDKTLDQPFVPYVSTKPEGSGLGLVICQRIVYDHGGTIELDNAKTGGAVVTIRLPK